MPIERADDHPIFELGGNTITSFAAPARGSDETALYRVDLPPGKGLPAHRHDHFDVFLVIAGGASLELGDETVELAEGDSVMVPIGVRHVLEAGADGCSILVTMLGGTQMFRDDGIDKIPEWVR
jgi:quercetin dioxygenase-like cupin family protein